MCVFVYYARLREERLLAQSEFLALGIAARLRDHRDAAAGRSS